MAIFAYISNQSKREKKKWIEEIIINVEIIFSDYFSSKKSKLCFSVLYRLIIDCLIRSQASLKLLSSTEKP